MLGGAGFVKHADSWQDGKEHTADTRGATDSYVSALCFDKALRERQTEPGTLIFLGRPPSS
jgi:hypothetical protein